jgi:hypothetical protein
MMIVLQVALFMLQAFVMFWSYNNNNAAKRPRIPDVKHTSDTAP